MIDLFRRSSGADGPQKTETSKSERVPVLSSPSPATDTDEGSESAQRSRLLFGLILGSMVALWGRRHRQQQDSGAQLAPSERSGGRSLRGSQSSNALNVVRLGLVADVQYADKDNKLVAGAFRHYRNALHKLARVVEAFESESATLDAVLQLGDLVDGQEQLEASRADLELVMEQFARLPLPLYHVLGNHCLLCGREWLLKRLRTRPYYDVPLGSRATTTTTTETSADSPEACWHLVVLDCLDVSLHWDDPSDPRRVQAERFLKEQAGTTPNAVPYNGGIGESQLVWLEGVLTECRTRREFALVVGHVPIAPGSAAPSLLLWNYEEVMTLFRAYRDVVKLVLAGHEHDGGYAQVDGIHYLTLPGLVNAAEGDDNAYAILELVGHSFARLHGFGRVPSRLLLFQPSC
ncbi:hypothetical protein CCYA_CCYA05G1550 [Cyanidiococcus yangmingshanensis]|nr:hypothetical protein CCYA_CCYA05G1550 [Cyanidiococcus yangmingshanensis]